MQLPGLLVEYLIDGSVALLWILPVLSAFGFILPSDTSVLILFIPGLYVIGMTIDFLAHRMVLPWKEKLKKKVYNQKRDENKNINFQAVPEKLIAYSSDLSNEFGMRSSRDRVARGTILNLILSTSFYVILNFESGLLNYWIVGLGIAGIILSIAMWVRYQKLSYDFEAEAFRILEEKLSKANNSEEPE